MTDQRQDQDRTIRVFVSSTFRDMQEDRDYLVKFVFPQLRKLCESRGVTWGEVDLRWGITEEEAAEGKVLPLCLEEIHRCRPYFIGLLGERYGSLPKWEKIPDILLEGQEWLKAHRDCSVTELEIIHGVLREEPMHRRAFFYFRGTGYLDQLPAPRSAQVARPRRNRRPKVSQTHRLITDRETWGPKTVPGRETCAQQSRKNETERTSRASRPRRRISSTG